MASDRQKSGYLWGPDQLKIANLDHYQRARDQDDIKREEYWAQSVFHGPSYSKMLELEIFQKKRRNNATNMVTAETIIGDQDSSVVNNIRSREIRNGVKYTRVAEPKYYENHVFSPDTLARLQTIILEICAVCNDEELKVLAYLIVQEKIDQVLMEDEKSTALGILGDYVRTVWTDNINDINSLNKFIGTKYKTERARKSIQEKIRDNFPLLTSL